MQQQQTIHKQLVRYSLILFLTGTIIGCHVKETQTVPLEEIAGNEDVLSFMKTFEGRGALSDSSQPTPPRNVLDAFRYPADLKLDLILSEPDVTQPVFMNFDHRGRLWVVQYNQYPYPRDLKVMSMDQHIRATFDKVPLPPNLGAKGADKITFFEDTNGDGTYDKATNAISGLNIATSVALGRGHIWVLNPPYLLAYPDPDGNGLPDGAPLVHLEGFGLEDTHAVANNLRWGPDGWLYGAQGSTCTANVSSEVSKNVRFNGQAIWRYHPGTKVFEVFAEGGGNTFDVEIDEKGRLYSGDNGAHRGQYYKQGAYYVRNFGKHGALTNPYAFGYLYNMELQGERVRFTHAFIKYEGASLPGRFDGTMIAINPLQSFVQLSTFEPDGSTFINVDKERILTTTDHWFRPVDITTGPDGAVYLADWYDSRLSHVDPRDTWSKSNGRIYRLGNKSGEEAVPAFDLSKYPNEKLIDLLSHPNRWFRQQALRQFGDRHDPAAVPALFNILETSSGQLALEALWALHLSGGFNDNAALTGLRHQDPFVRMWTVRLSGDDHTVSGEISAELATLAAKEPHAEVRSQLAATAKRLPGNNALPIIKNLLHNEEDSDDKDIPLQIWWALESKAETDREAVLAMFDDPAIWRQPIVRDIILERLMQRYVMAGNPDDYIACAELLEKAPSSKEAKLLLTGLQEGLRGRDVITLSPVLVQALKPYQAELSKESLTLALRQGENSAIEKALEVIRNPKASLGERLTYIRIFGEMNEPKSIPHLLAVVENNQSSPALRQAALQALQRYDEPEIGQRIVKAYPDKLRADPDVRIAALSLFASRENWAQQLLNAIEREKQPGEKFIARTINKNDVPDQVVRQLKLLDDPAIVETANRLWPEVRFATTQEKNNRIEQVSAVLQSKKGDAAHGKALFAKTCGACHRLFGEGGTLGPDLSGYDRRNVNDLLTNIVDPGAYVREEYVTYRITTDDGRMLTGTISGRSGSAMTVSLLNGEQITLVADQVKKIEAQPSIMPDNLLNAMTDEEIQDLFAYIMKY